MTQLCTNRIKDRGISHPSLTYQPNVVDILSGFAGSYEPITDAEKKTVEYLPLNVNTAAEVNVKTVLDYLAITVTFHNRGTYHWTRSNRNAPLPPKSTETR